MKTKSVLVMYVFQDPQLFSSTVLQSCRRLSVQKGKRPSLFV